MAHMLIDFIRKPAIMAATLALVLGPSAALAQFEEEGIGFGEGYYDDAGVAEDNWFYDGYEGYGYDGYGEVGFGEEEEGIYGGYEDYGEYYEEGALGEDDDWF